MAHKTREALAYLLTWTTYGTWLRGDPRGYVGRTLVGEDGVAPKRNVFGTPYDADQGRTYGRDADALKTAPVYLSQTQAACVAEALCELAERMGYEVMRASVAPDHVHVLVGAHPHGKDEIMRRMKSISAVRLTQKFGHPPAKAGGSSEGGGRWWTRDGSKREKRDDGAVEAAIEYVAGQEHMLAGVVDGRVIREAPGK